MFAVCRWGRSLAIDGGSCRRLGPPHQPDRRQGRVPGPRPGPAPRHRRAARERGRSTAGAGTGQVHDRYITSPRQVHDRLNQIQSLRGDTGNPCGMTPPLVQRPDPRTASLATAPCQSSTRQRATRTRSPPPWQPRWDGAADPAACPGRRYEQDQPAAQLEQNGGEPAARDARHHQSDEQSGRPGNGTKRAWIGKASGSADRSFGPDAVRYMSVTIATHDLQRHTMTHGGTRRKRPAGPRFRSERAVFAGGGRCWVRTNVG